MNLKAVSIIVLLIAIAGLLFLVINHYLFSPNPVAIAFQVLAAGLMIWARVTFGVRSFHGAANTTEGELVTHGPYQYWRHPIYASLLYFIWAGVLAQANWKAILAAIVISGALITRALLEEQFLYQAYPDYAVYASKTWRFIPFVF
jgi:protein-S-isoprenylcysteine O-methyltransferase Ste14